MTRPQAGKPRSIVSANDRGDHRSARAASPQVLNSDTSRRDCYLTTATSIPPKPSPLGRLNKTRHSSQPPIWARHPGQLTRSGPPLPTESRMYSASLPHRPEPGAGPQATAASGAIAGWRSEGSSGNRSRWTSTRVCGPFSLSDRAATNTKLGHGPRFREICTTAGCGSPGPDHRAAVLRQTPGHGSHCTAHRARGTRGGADAEAPGCRGGTGTQTGRWAHHHCGSPSLRAATAPDPETRPGHSPLPPPLTYASSSPRTAQAGTMVDSPQITIRVVHRGGPQRQSVRLLAGLGRPGGEH